MAEEACFYCQEEESTDVKGVLLGELMLSRFELGLWESGIFVSHKMSQNIMYSPILNLK